MATNQMSLQDRVLGYLNELVREGELTLTTSALAEQFDLSPQSASNLCARLLVKGLVDRVSPGRYAIRQIGLLGTPAAAETITLAVGAAFGDEPHRIAYRSALAHHDLIRHPSRVIQVALTRQVRMQSLSGRPLEAIYETGDTLSVGSRSAGNRAMISDLERSLIDAGRRPELVGGLDVLAEALTTAHSRINWDSLSRYFDLPVFSAAGRRLASVCSRAGLVWKGKSPTQRTSRSPIRAYPRSTADPGWRDPINAVVWSSTDVDTVQSGTE